MRVCGKWLENGCKNESTCRVHPVLMTFRFSSPSIPLMISLMFAGWGNSPVLAAVLPSAFSLRHQAHTLTLQVEQLPLAVILERMGQSLQFGWHDPGVLSNEPVSVACTGARLEVLLDCLLAGRHSYLIRQREPGVPFSQEVWLLKPASVRILQATASPESAGSLKQQRQRARHLARFIADDRADRVEVKAYLLEGLVDASPLVRAQAIFGLSQQEPEQATRALATGLEDGDASVRLAAVENAGHTVADTALLRTALADEDESVRTLAVLKLEEAGSTGFKQ